MVKREEKKALFLFTKLAAVCLLLFFLDRRGWLNSLRGFLEKPFLAIEEKTYGLTSSSKKAAKIQQLEVRVGQLAVEQNQLMVCREENASLRRMLGAPLPAQWNFLPAKVIGFSQHLKIEQGTKDGVELGMMVVNEGLLVGRVETVRQHFSLLQTPFSSRIPVLVRCSSERSSHAQGLLVGYSDELVLEKVLQEEDLAVGDLVVTNGQSDWLADLVIGEVEEVLSKPVDVHKKARVKPLLNYDKLKTVFVVIEP